MLQLKHIDIGAEALSFFNKNWKANLFEINNLVKEQCGIVSFFEKEEDYFQFQKEEFAPCPLCEPKSEYGDYQTNILLSRSIASHLASQGVRPQVLIEPTCGKGSFILSAIETFPSLQQVFGIEINEQYIWSLKFELLEYFLAMPKANKPEIRLFCDNIFDFNFQDIKRQISKRDLLIIGNPPWVTNSTLSTLESDNLPQKNNLKKTRGIEAITGKGNFDIGECIALKMLNLFSKENGNFAFLIKNSVIKNIVYEQHHNKYPIANLQGYTIDAKKEFGASVGAGLFTCNLNSTPDFTLQEFNFYTLKPMAAIGWVGGKFALDIDKYLKHSNLDGVCPFEWRQGVKHDCAKIMELERINGGFRNALGEEFELEEDLIYGILKSSDLQVDTIDTPRKYTIVTQKKIGQETKDILELLPKTKAYLEKHKEYFIRRKSSIYKGKPMYSIFGVGDYSFMPYKVAISGLYKQTRFTLVKPSKTVLLLDDTCYFIGFNKLEEAQNVQSILNNADTQAFIQSFISRDAKRAITKALLMRISIPEKNQTPRQGYLF